MGKPPFLFINNQPLSDKSHYLCNIINIGGQNMCIIERNTRNITVRLSNARWNRLMELENAYRTAKSIVRAKKECERTKGMTKEEAMKFIDSL